MEESKSFSENPPASMIRPNVTVSLSPALAKIQQALQATYTEVDAQKRKEAEDLMANFLNTDPRSFESLITLIASESSHGNFSNSPLLESRWGTL